MNSLLITVIVIIVPIMSWSLVNVHTDRNLLQDRLQATVASHEQEISALHQAHGSEIADRNARIGNDADRIRGLQDQLGQTERRLAILEQRLSSLDDVLADTTLIIPWHTLRARSHRGEVRAVERLDERTLAVRLGNGLWLQTEIPDGTSVAQILVSEAAPLSQGGDVRQARSPNNPLARTLD